MAMGSLATSFLGALQASIAVLLTVTYGFIAARYGLLKESSSKDVSKLCVKLFLPALLITNVGSQLHLDNVVNYIPILSRSRDTWASNFDPPHRANECFQSLVLYIRPFVFASELDGNKVVRPSIMDRTCCDLQQYNLPPFATCPVSRRYRYLEIPHQEWRINF
jgi:hypothetical protein